MGKISDYVDLVLFPIRDAIGMYFIGVPLRINEIWMGIESIPILIKSKLHLEKNGLRILLIMFLNLALFSIGFAVHSRTVVTSFAFKYLVRQVLYLFFMFAASLCQRTMKKIYFLKLFDYMTIIQLLYYCFLIGGEFNEV